MFFEAFDLSGYDEVAFYKDGVGTSTCKPWAILGGAFGFGLTSSTPTNSPPATTSARATILHFPNMISAMFNRIILAAVMLAISTAASAARTSRKRRNVRRSTIRRSKTCSTKLRHASAPVPCLKAVSSGPVATSAWARSSPRNAKAIFWANWTRRRGGPTTVSRSGASANTLTRMAPCTARLKRSVAPMWRAIIQPSSSRVFAPGSNKIPVMAASRAVSDIIPAIAAGRWMPQCSGRAENRIDCPAQKISSQLVFA
jgi:hypothetical protein